MTRLWEYDKITLACENKQEKCGCSSMVEHQPSKLDTWVRFPSPAYARVAQLVEHDLAKVGAAGSSPVSRSEREKRGHPVDVFFFFLCNI